MKHIALFLFTAILGSFVLPLGAQAYTTTGSEAFTVQNTVGVFIIDFAFGHEKHEVHIPVRAVRSDTPVESALSFQVTDNENRKALGSAIGIVLSSATVEDGSYVVPKGIRQPFRLLVLYPKSVEDTSTALRTKVTHLPFSFDGTRMLQLNTSELQYYTTDLTLIGTSAGVLPVGK